MKKPPQAGFTAVELLITLFVAAAFLIASYQLFNVVIQDGGQARAESRAGNIAYDYMRRYAPLAASTCSNFLPMTNAPVTAEGLTDVKVSIAFSCANNLATSPTKVDVTVTYNNPAQTVQYSTYTVGSSGIVLNNLIGWWKLDGNLQGSAGSLDGVAAVNAVPGNRNSIPNKAYSFNGTDAYIQLSDSIAPAVGTSNVTLAVWVWTSVTPNRGFFMKVGNNASGYGIGMGTTNVETMGTKIIMLYEGVRWIQTSTDLPTGWHHVAMVIDGSGVPTAYLDGVSIGSYSGTGPINPVGQTYLGGRASGTNPRYFAGNIDDARVYNRALSAAEITAIYNEGGS